MNRDESQLAGSTLAGRYDILALIGTGGMGAVYRARDRELDELIALKVIRSELAHDAAIVERFRHEVKLARRVTHANVARTFELGHADGLMYCTMELVEGESLQRRLGRQRKLSVAEAATIACAVCDALSAAHAVDVIHRDIKPDNVLIASAGRIVLADFGIASAGVAAHHEIAGTPAYMAPEQTRGAAPTPATDVYAVGVLLYEMVSGTPAFTGTIAQIFEAKQACLRLELEPSTEIEPALVAAIADATAQDPAHRIGSAAQLRARIAGWADRALVGAAVDAPGHVGDVRSVVVLAPVADVDGSRLYLADAVFEQLLRRLQLRSRLRVLPRVAQRAEPGAMTVGLFASDDLRIEIASATGRPVVTLRLPLAVDRLAEVAEAAAAAITTTIALDRPREEAPSAEALDLLLRARHIALGDVEEIVGAIALLERANALLPRDPRITANLAVLQVRRAFFAPEIADDLLTRSRELVRVALETGPRVAEAHLAAGHIELNIGEAVAAAGHYRIAIACAPHVAEAHESLGRMLLEAGFLEAGFARIDEALAIAPGLNAVRWDMARAYALEARWDDHDRVVADLWARSFGRPTRSAPLRLRFAAWRGDHATIAGLRAETGPSFDNVLVAAALDVYMDGAWPARKAQLMAIAAGATSSVRRRRAFVAQLVAEAAGFAGDVEASLAMIARSVDEGLFDVHWLDRCPVIAVVRAAPGFAPLRAIVKRRADGVLDALYGDHEVAGASDTVAASMPGGDMVRGR